jgi:spore germination protein GerM
MKKLILILITLFAFILSGCGIGQRLQEWKNGTAPISEFSENLEQGEDDIFGADYQEENENQEKREVTLYFADESGSFLKEEKRLIPKNESIARTTVSALIDGPEYGGLYPTIPAAAILDNIRIENGICTVDFSGELADNHPGGQTAEELTVYSIVNTLTQFKTIDAVKILVGGEEVDSIAGHIDISRPLEENHDLLR